MAQVTQRDWEGAINHLIGISAATVARNAELEERLAQLEHELRYCRRTHAVSPLHMESQARNVHEIRPMITQSSPPLIFCALDGNTGFFDGQLVARGFDGGRQAGHRLAQAIADYLVAKELHVSQVVAFWMTIYISKSTVMDDLMTRGVCTLDQFEDFCQGFSEASSRFSIVDVGPHKEIAQAKVIDAIDTYARFPQTLRIFLRGSGAYLPFLGTLSEERLLDKVVLVQNAEEAGCGLEKLFLPVLKVGDLFMRETWPSFHYPSPPSTGVASLYTGSVGTVGGLPSPQSPVAMTLPKALSEKGTRQIDPDKPLHRQDPPPCNEFYLMTCTKGDACKYCHDYDLTQEQLETLAVNARKAPCNFLKKGLPCANGESCCWGHECPNGMQCFHYSKGKCWFKGEGMHKVQASL